MTKGGYRERRGIHVYDTPRIVLKNEAYDPAISKVFCVMSCLVRDVNEHDRREVRPLLRRMRIPSPYLDSKVNCVAHVYTSVPI